MLGRLFTDHPRSLGLSWFEHGTGAVKIGFKLIRAGVAALIHGIVPGLFTTPPAARSRKPTLYPKDQIWVVKPEQLVGL
jgi:hypothetical protein